LVLSFSTILDESTPFASIVMYQRRNKFDMLMKQLQLLEPGVSTENDSSIGDSKMFDTCYTNLVNLPITLRKDKRSCQFKYRHPISQCVYTKLLFMQYEKIIAAINYVRIPSFVEEAFEDRN